MTEPLLTVEEVADRLGLSHGYTYQLIARGDLAKVKIGKTVRVTEESLAKFIEERTHPARRTRGVA